MHVLRLVPAPLVLLEGTQQACGEAVTRSGAEPCASDAYYITGELSAWCR